MATGTQDEGRAAIQPPSAHAGANAAQIAPASASTPKSQSIHQTCARSTLRPRLKALSRSGTSMPSEIEAKFCPPRPGAKIV